MWGSVQLVFLILGLLPFAVAQPCQLCNNDTFLCHHPTSVASGADQCAIRRAALVGPAWGCQGGLFLETYLHVYDELGLGAPTFNVHVFRNPTDLDLYANCSVDVPTPVASFLQRSCLAFERVDVGFLGRDQGQWETVDQKVGPAFAVECLSPGGCSIQLEYYNNCTLKETGAYPLGISALVLCCVVICFCLFVWVYFAMHRRFATAEMVVQLSGISVIMLLSLVFWAAFVMSSTFAFSISFSPLVGVRPPQGSPYASMTDTVFWADKILLILSCLLHLLFLFQFIVAMHAKPKLVAAVFICTAVALIGCVGLPIAFYIDMYGRNGQDFAPHMVAFYAIMYGVQVIESLLFLIYGLLLLRGHFSSHGFDRTVAKTVVLLVLLVLPNIGRIGIAVYTWVSLYFAVFAGDFTGVFYAGFDFYVMRFSNYQAAQLFYVFAFLIPDIVPYVVLLALLFGGVFRGVSGTSGSRKSEYGQPLLETPNRPASYDI